MNKAKRYSRTSRQHPRPSTPAPRTAQEPPSRRKRFERPVTGRVFANPVDYTHPFKSMARFADLLALRHDANRTRHSYYRQLRLIQEHFNTDPASLSEAHLRKYLLHVKLKKHWKSNTLRQCVACARIFYCELLRQANWTVFSDIRTKDHSFLPAVLSRSQVVELIAHIRLRRYRTPIKLIYCCGLRLGECLALTVHDIPRGDSKLIIRNSKGHQDRVVPLPRPMREELQAYWKFHRNPLLLFPNAGRGDPAGLAERMSKATRTMPYSSLQRLMRVAGSELNLPSATVHTLRHSFATHLLEAGTHLHTIQTLLGHKQIDSTMVYLHLTHQTAQDTLKLMEELCRGLPR